MAMGIFANILEKLGMGHHAPKYDERPYGPKTVPPGTKSPEDLKPGGSGGGGGTSTTTTATTAPAKPTAISEVDVVAQLEKRAAANSQKLNWRTSIVDLLKLLDIDSSLEARKSLAKELGAPESVMHESADMNMWLHKEVLKRVAANGGNVPANLLD
jgi:hypothetical protein